MSATPTGAEAMKEAERLADVMAQKLVEAVTPAGVLAYVDAREAFTSHIRKLVEAQPAAVPSGVQYIGWFAMDGTPLNSGAENALKVRARAPAAPLVGEPPKCPDCGIAYGWHLAACPAASEEASPAAPAGVPTEQRKPLLIDGRTFAQDLEQLIRAAEGSVMHGWKAQDAARRMRQRIEAKAGSVNLPACDSSEASGSAMPARPTLPGEDAARDVLAERVRQQAMEGWTPKHDDEHGGGEMAIAAACYALADHKGLEVQTVRISKLWEWTGWGLFKPKDKRRNLVRAAALLLAEIERLDRALLAGGDQKALPPSSVPPFDFSKPCDVQRMLSGALTKGDPMPTMCERCHNPHHACDNGSGVPPSSVQAVDGDEPTDAQMLDWLERHFTRIGGVYVQADHSVVPLAIDCGDDTMAEAGTRVRDALRDAIRAALKEQGQ